MLKRGCKLLTKFMLMGICMLIVMMQGKAYASQPIPRVEKIVKEYDKVYQGDTQTFDILFKYKGKVQYKVWLCNRKDGIWRDITNGYTSPVEGNRIYTITTPNLTEGNYTLSVWVKRAGTKPLDKRGFDSFLGYDTICLKNNGQDPNMKFGIKHNYSVGQSIQIEPEKDKNYFYKYSIYDVLNKKQVVPYSDYKSSILWKPNKEGVYLLTINLKSIEKIPVPKEDDNKVQEDNLKDEDKLKDNENSIYRDKINLEKENISLEKKDNKEFKKINSEDENLDQDNKEENSFNKDIIKSNEDSKDNKDNEDSKTNQENEDNKDNKNKEENKDNKEIEYKEIEKEEKVTKLIIVGNPYKEVIVNKGPKAPIVKSLIVGNAAEGTRIYIKSAANSRSKNVGYIYGSLQGVRVLKTVGNYQYIEAIDYNTLKPIRGYIPKSELRTIKPNNTYSVLVNMKSQRIYVFKNNKLIKNIICSTGQDCTPTPTGTYVIGSRGAYFYTGYKNSVICYNWVRFNNNFLFHSVLYYRNGGIIKAEEAKLGKKASHGCIRMSLNDIRWFYNTIPSGTPIVIQG